MAKKRKVKTFSFQGFDIDHYRTTEQYAQAVESLFDSATTEIAHYAARGKYDPDKPFSLSDYPSTQKKVESIIKSLTSTVTAVVANGSRKQWLFACQKNDDFVASIFETTKLSKARLSKMQDRNLDALDSFQGRKVNGLDLSQRVWKYTDQYKAQIEQGLDVGLGEGRSAQQLSRDLRQNLKDPDRLYRRVRDKRGNLQLSKNAKAFKPGTGVYRSSYKNAMRLTRSEVNMAYREADYLRWQQLDFVIGFEVHRSQREPLCKCSLCERLVGKYPKTFKFKGWHPQCMCYATAILMDEEDFDNQELSDLKSALRGTAYKKLAVKNEVKDVPDGFKEWVAENTEKQKNWASTPYFIKDNFTDGKLSKGLVFATSQAPKIDPIAIELQAVQAEFDAKRKDYQNWGISDADVEKAIMSKNPTLARSLMAAHDAEKRKLEQDFRRDIESIMNVLEQARAANAEIKNILPNATSTDIVSTVKLKYIHRQIVSNVREWVMGRATLTNEIASLKTRIAEAKVNAIQKAKTQTQSPLNVVIDKIDKFGVEYRDVKNLATPLSEQEMIDRIGGGDRTTGSCASLAFAWAANKGGLDVLDFRGGQSLKYFCRTLNLHEIARNVGGVSSYSVTGIQLMKQTQIGKQYYLAIGRHAAVVRQVAKGKYEYLELQSATRNGWHELNSKQFGWRFAARGSCAGLLIDIETLQNDAMFRKMVGYINTSESSQLKGASGQIR